MAKSGHLKSSPETICLLDSDVIINWLTKEETSEANLWEAPHKIIRLMEENIIDGYATIIGLLEIRFVLRRKKNLSDDKIKDDVAKILNVLEILVPDEVNLLKANGLQSDISFLSPFDAIFIAVGLSMKNAALISRDKYLLQTAS